MVSQIVAKLGQYGEITTGLTGSTYNATINKLPGYAHSGNLQNLNIAQVRAILAAYYATQARTNPAYNPKIVPPVPQTPAPSPVPVELVPSKKEAITESESKFLLANPLPSGLGWTFNVDTTGKLTATVTPNAAYWAKAGEVSVSQLPPDLAKYITIPTKAGYTASSLQYNPKTGSFEVSYAPIPNPTLTALEVALTTAETGFGQVAYGIETGIYDIAHYITGTKGNVPIPIGKTGYFMNPPVKNVTAEQLAGEVGLSVIAVGLLPAVAPEVAVPMLINAAGSVAVSQAFNLVTGKGILSPENLITSAVVGETFYGASSLILKGASALIPDTLLTGTAKTVASGLGRVAVNTALGTGIGYTISGGNIQQAEESGLFAGGFSLAGELIPATWGRVAATDFGAKVSGKMYPITSSIEDAINEIKYPLLKAGLVKTIDKEFVFEKTYGKMEPLQGLGTIQELEIPRTPQITPEGGRTTIQRPYVDTGIIDMPAGMADVAHIGYLTETELPPPPPPRGFQGLGLGTFKEKGPVPDLEKFVEPPKDLVPSVDWYFIGRENVKPLDTGVEETAKAISKSTSESAPSGGQSLARAVKVVEEPELLYEDLMKFKIITEPTFNYHFRDVSTSAKALSLMPVIKTKTVSATKLAVRQNVKQLQRLGIGFRVGVKTSTQQIEKLQTLQLQKVAYDTMLQPIQQIIQKQTQQLKVGLDLDLVPKEKAKLTSVPVPDIDIDKFLLGGKGKGWGQYKMKHYVGNILAPVKLGGVEKMLKITKPKRGRH